MGSSAHGSSWAVLAAFLCLAFCAGRAESTQVNDHDKLKVIAGVRAHYDALKKIQNLVITYRLRFDHRCGAKRFAFAEVELINAHKGGNYRTEMRYKHDDNGKQVLRERVCTWNGKAAMNIVDNSTSIDIQQQPDTLVFYYRYYFDYLGYPDGSALAAKYHSLAPIEKGYWLPEALEQNSASYKLLEQRERIGAADCLVLERVGNDKLWLDPDHGYMVRRRDVFFPGSSQMRERITVAAERLIEGVWLPTTIARDVFGGRDESADFHNVVTNHFTLTVHEISTKSLPDSYFVLPVVDGMIVYDKFRGMHYKKLGRMA